MTAPLPNHVRRFIDNLTRWARGYGNHLKWNEIDKLKGELMNDRSRWQLIDLTDSHRYCLGSGMRTADADVIVGLVSRRQAGRRLVPSSTYRDFSWPSRSDDS